MAKEQTVSGKTYGRVSTLFLQHALAVSDALISAELACKSRGMAFTPEHDLVNCSQGRSNWKHLQWKIGLKSGETKQKVGVIPDGTFAIEGQSRAGTPQRLYFFLEADRGTMPVWRKNLRLSSIYRKVLAYAQTRRSKILRDRFGIPGFQVIFITKSQNRLERMKEAATNALEGRTTSLFLFATPEEFRRDPLAVMGMI